MAKLGVGKNSLHTENLTAQFTKLRNEYMKWSVDRELGRTNEAGRHT